MPSTFSPSLRIELIGAGEQAGTWNQTTNNNLGELLEQAIAGQTVLDVTAGNITLTSLNGVVDEARSAVLVAVGTPGVTRVLTIPNEQKPYTVINQTTNIVQVKTASGTAFNCPPSATTIIACDGNNGVQGSGIAPLTSPIFTGVPIAPTATQGTNTTQIATTAFVNTEIAADTANFAPLASPAFTGVPTAPTAAVTTNTTQLATTAFVNAEIAADTANLAPLASPAFTGVPIAPTATQGTNTTQLATTAFVASSLPVGLIVMWSGSIGAIPAGWALCDGTGGRPDLRDRFIVGAGTSYAIGNTGGFNTVTLDVTQIPSHAHTGSGTTVTANIDHSHSGTTNTVDINHVHNVNGTTDIQNAAHGHSGSTDAQGSHQHVSPIVPSGNQSPIYPYGSSGIAGSVKESGNDFVTRTFPLTNDAGIHNHNVSTGIQNANHAHAFNVNSGAMSANNTHNHSITTAGMNSNTTHAHTYSFTTSNVGGGAAHENRPPYYALAFIIKT